MATFRISSRYFSVSALLFSIILLASGGGAAAEPKFISSPSSQFVQKLGDTALMSLTSKNAPRSQREKRVREILRNNFDTATIGRFAMGTYWKDASAAQRREYLDLFEDMIVQTYTTRFEDYSGQTLKVDGAIASGENDFIVSSQVLQKGGPPINLEWRVRSKDGALRIVDVVVESVSMSVTQRSDFASVIQRGGGRVEALLATLRERRKVIARQKT